MQNMQSNNKIDFFYEYSNLIIQFPKNKYIVNKFKGIAKDLDKIEWIKFFNIIIQSNNKNMKEIKKKLNNLSKKTDDIKLKKIINAYNEL